MVTKRDNRQPTTDDNRQGEYRAICLWKMGTGQAEFCNYCSFAMLVQLLKSWLCRFPRGPDKFLQAGADLALLSISQTKIKVV